MFKSTAQKDKETFEALKEKFGYTNPNQAPHIEKVVVSSGVGSITDKNKLKLIGEKMALITGQKPASQNAKKSIAQFKVREGQLAGYRSTLRGANAYGFLDKVINIAFPRTRDFRGVSKDSVDEMGNYSFGIKEHTIFPETADEELRNVFGFSVTIVTTSNSKEETLALLEHIGIPFKKEE